MYDSTKSLGVQTIYIRIRDFGTGFCPFCDSEVEKLYPDAGHTFRAIDGWKNVITYWYRCRNSNCPVGGNFKALQPYILPYKKFGQDVWLFACLEWERFKTSPKEISQRLKFKGVYISEDTTTRILEDYKLLKTSCINEKTLEIIEKQGYVIVGCDGTPTDTGSDTLWTFYDVISGRMLHVAYLPHADAKTLCKIFRNIEKNYHSPIKCFLSDHQPSIVKACQEFDPEIPHQTCHYHFLRNQWAFIQEKDTHMNKELRKTINSLAIGRSEGNIGAKYSQDIRVEKQTFFEPLYRHLKKSVNFRNDEFEALKGMKAFAALSKIIKDIDKELLSLDPELRPVKQLRTARDVIQQKLMECQPQQAALTELMVHFQHIRKTLGDPKLKKEEKIHKLAVIYSSLFDKYHSQTSYSSQSDLKSIPAKFNLGNAVILCQWCRLWNSHKDQLFFYYDIKGLEKTNIFNEQIFSILKRQVVEAHGQAHKAYMVLTRGDMYLTDICSKDALNIHEVLTRYDLKDLFRLKKPLQEKVDHERMYFRNSKLLNNSVSTIAEKIRDRAWEKEEKG